VSRKGVFTQSNEAEANRLFGYWRGDDGRLTGPVVVPTGGRGDGVPHLTSQGSVVLTSDGGRLLVANAGSNDVSVVSIGSEPMVVAIAPSGGSAPKSVAEHDGLVYVLNTGDRSLAGFTLGGEGLELLTESRRQLSDDADAAQVTDRGANAILVFPVADDGRLGEPHTTASAGPTPYGFTFAAGDTLVVTEAFGAAKGKAAASSYRLNGRGAEIVTESVGNGRTEICWAVPSNDGRYVFSTNFADGAVSRYAVNADGELVLEDAAAGIAVDGESGLRDEDLTRDGRFLYAVDADGGRIFGWRVDDGVLTALGSWEGLPATVAGLAAT
jgi:6-phosphogluconolactonase (cycloisomerase 2 family)